MPILPMGEQKKFFECQECSAIVERIFQNGICRACLNAKLKAVRLVIDTNHAVQASRVVLRQVPRRAVP